MSQNYIPQLVFRGKPYITVSAKGISNGLSDTFNDGADFGPDTLLNATSPSQYGPPFTQTVGLQEAINYVAGKGGGVIRLSQGTFNITSTGQTTINIPFNVPIRILGSGRGITILQSPYGFFNLLSGNTQNTNPIEIGQMTLKTTQANSSAGGYFVAGNTSPYGWANLYIHDMDMYGGGNVGTGTFNLGYYTGVQGGAPMTNVLLKNLYLDTLGTSGGNECYTFPMIYGDNFVLDNVTYKNTPNGEGGVGFFSVYGGVIVWKNSKVDSSTYSYINTVPYSTTPSVNSTNLFTKLILENMIFDNYITSGAQAGFVPVDVIINNSLVRKTGITLYSGGASNVTYHSIAISNTFISEEHNGLISDVTAYVIKLTNVTVPNNNNQASGIAPIVGLALPYQSMTVNIEVSNIYIGNPVSQGIIPLNIPGNTTSIQAQYNIRWKGIGYASSWILNGTYYNDPNGFASMVHANPNYFLSVDYTYFDIQNNILYKVTKNPNTPSTPSVPASGTAQVNGNSYPVEVYVSGGSATQVQVTRYGSTYTVWSSSTSTSIPPIVVRLNSGDSITITYTTAPTWTWVPA